MSFRHRSITASISPFQRSVSAGAGCAHFLLTSNNSRMSAWILYRSQALISATTIRPMMRYSSSVGVAWPPCVSASSWLPASVMRSVRPQGCGLIDCALNFSVSCARTTGSTNETFFPCDFNDFAEILTLASPSDNHITIGSLLAGAEEQNKRAANEKKPREEQPKRNQGTHHFIRPEVAFGASNVGRTITRCGRSRCCSPVTYFFKVDSRLQQRTIGISLRIRYRRTLPGFLPAGFQSWTHP